MATLWTPKSNAPRFEAVSTLHVEVSQSTNDESVHNTGLIKSSPRYKTVNNGKVKAQKIMADPKVHGLGEGSEVG